MNGEQANARAGLSPEQLAKQIDAMRSEAFEPLRTYVDDRLSALQRRRERWWGRFRPELYFLLTLLVLAVVYALLGGRIPRLKTQAHGQSQGVDNHQGDGADKPPYVAQSSLLSQALVDPDSALREYTSTNKLRTQLWIGEVAGATHLGQDANAISPEIADKLHTLGRELGKKRLRDEEVTLLRGTFLAYAYGRWVLQNDRKLPEKFSVDPSFDDYEDALVRSLLERLDLGDVLEGSTHPTDPKVSTAIVLRWMQSYPNTTTHL